MEMHTDVPHAGLGYQFLGSKTNSRLKAIAFGRSHRKAVGGQRLRLEAVASRWYRLDKPTKVTNSRLRPGHRFLVGGHRKAVGGQHLKLEAVTSRWWVVCTSKTKVTAISKVGGRR